MRFAWIAAVKDWARWRRDPLALLTAVGIPLVLVTLITWVFGGRDAVPQGRLLVADEDQTFFSQILKGAFSREPISKMIAVESIDRENGLRRMERGEASALLVVPKGFQNTYFRNQPVQLRLVTNPAQRILPNIIEETLSMLVDAGFYLQELT